MLAVTTRLPLFSTVALKSQLLLLRRNRREQDNRRKFRERDSFELINSQDESSYSHQQEDESEEHGEAVDRELTTKNRRGIDVQVLDDSDDGITTARARAALGAGAPILCDARMVSEGITRARLPADNRVICTLHDPKVPALAKEMGNTRSAAALELWRSHLAGALVAIGNAPTALFHLLNMLEDPACPRPAAIIGGPVGFVGAVESKAALWADPPVPCAIMEGRPGGSAITVAAINAIASRAE